MHATSIRVPLKIYKNTGQAEHNKIRTHKLVNNNKIYKIYKIKSKKLTVFPHLLIQGNLYQLEIRC